MTREEAKAEIKAYIEAAKTESQKIAFRACLNVVEQMKPKTGHWEWVQYDGNPNIGNWHCSECKSIVIECVSKEKKGGIPLYKYCPQCGAKIE